MFKLGCLAVLSLLVPATLIALVGSSGVAKADAIIENAEFCVDATHFRFRADVSEPLIGDANHTTVSMVFRIGADAPVFGGAPLERIAVNFDLDTGAVTLGPLVETFGAPLDRWQNKNPFNDFSVTPIGGLGSGDFRIEGSVPNGTQAFVAGDSVNQVLQREVSSHVGQVDAVLSNVSIISCDNQIGDNVTFGVGVTLGWGVVIEDGATIGDFTEIRDEVFIGENVIIGPNSLLDTKTEVDDEAVLGAGCMVKTTINHIFHPATVAKEAEIGAGCDLAGGTEVGRNVKIGENFTTTSIFLNEVEHTALSAPTIKRGAEIGDYVSLDHGTVVAKGVVLGDFVTAASGVCGEVSDCLPKHYSGGVCGETSDCFPKHYVTFERNATVGDNSTFGVGTTVKTQASVGLNADVGEGVFIGAKAVVEDNITIGDGAFIGPGVVVDTNVPAGEALH